MLETQSTINVIPGFIAYMPRLSEDAMRRMMLRIHDTAEEALQCAMNGKIHLRLFLNGLMQMVIAMIYPLIEGIMMAIIARKIVDGQMIFANPTIEEITLDIPLMGEHKHYRNGVEKKT